MAAQDQKRINYFIGALVFIVIAFSGYLTIGNLAGEQSRQHQQSVSPVFALIENELTSPLHIAKTLADAGIFDEYFAAEEPDKEKLTELLSELNQKFGYEFYLAHDKSRKQYNSDGRVFDLIEGQIIWYFALKNEFDSEVQAVLGKREDVHLYIDVRQYDENRRFIGFAGVGKSLSDFLESFEDFRKEYGHEFIFVNNRSQIVLSSIEDLAPTQAADMESRIGIKNIEDVDWFDDFVAQSQGETEPSEIVSGENGNLLVSRLELQNLNWQLYLVTPLNVRQAEVSKSFALYVAVGLILLIIAYKVLYNVIEKYMHKMSRRINQDALTKLPNREHVDLFFTSQRRNHRQMAVIVADLDNFKTINDQHGHQAGDEALQKVTDVFKSKLPKNGIVSRWGGEEFVFVLPDTDLKPAMEFAEACRLQLERTPFEQGENTIKLTASFGVYASRQYSDTLKLMVEKADRAMYKAKEQGKNLVVETV